MSHTIKLLGDWNIQPAFAQSQYYSLLTNVVHRYLSC